MNYCGKMSMAIPLFYHRLVLQILFRTTYIFYRTIYFEIYAREMMLLYPTSLKEKVYRDNTQTVTELKEAIGK